MAEKAYTKDILAYATHGINENIEADTVIEVKLRDLVFVARTLQEFVQYFHNQDHYPAIEDLHEYLGDRKNGRAFHLLSIANYQVIERMLPKMLDDLYDAGAFDSSEIPFYFEAKA